MKKEIAKMIKMIKNKHKNEKLSWSTLLDEKKKSKSNLTLPDMGKYSSNELVKLPVSDKHWIRPLFKFGFNYQGYENKFVDQVALKPYISLLQAWLSFVPTSSAFRHSLQLMIVGIRDQPWSEDYTQDIIDLFQAYWTPKRVRLYNTYIQEKKYTKIINELFINLVHRYFDYVNRLIDEYQFTNSGPS